MTLIATKKRFIEYLEKQIKDDEFVVLTQTLSGNMSVNKKRNSKTMQFDFAADAFAQEGLGHIMFGKTPVVAICICPPEFISEQALEKVKKAEV